MFNGHGVKIIDDGILTRCVSLHKLASLRKVFVLKNVYTGNMPYNNPIPVAVAILFTPNFQKVLIGERKIEPCVGGKALFGGYADSGETPENTAKREVFEETGQGIEKVELQYESSAVTANNRMLLFFSGVVPEELFDSIADSEEMKNIRFISYEELQAESLCFPLHQDACLKAWTKYRSGLQHTVPKHN